MAFLKITSPHAHGPMSTGRVMRLVIISTLPGLVALTWFFWFRNAQQYSLGQRWRLGI